jgi:hypothetical protein
VRRWILEEYRLRKGINGYKRCWYGSSIISLRELRKVNYARAGGLETRTKKGYLPGKKKEGNFL